ncbi:hypothetical protein [Caulobacter sp. 17J65-9]|uniref:hypothetical protein n=1 Tax=Caulobacter sp. 17J65-9 TaxID=2709382 RepID=UPI0013C7321B|nr:hypothetical protein [Caulobacter sp. 17J65-9]NEX94475.1 hypothetical protein [Caulobacter sp. 17J65-9]
MNIGRWACRAAIGGLAAVAFGAAAQAGGGPLKVRPDSAWLIVEEAEDAFFDYAPAYGRIDPNSGWPKPEALGSWREVNGRRWHVVKVKPGDYVIAGMALSQSIGCLNASTVRFSVTGGQVLYLGALDARGAVEQAARRAPQGGGQLTYVSVLDTPRITLSQTEAGRAAAEAIAGAPVALAALENARFRTPDRAIYGRSCMNWMATADTKPAWAEGQAPAAYARPHVAALPEGAAPPVLRSAAADAPAAPTPKWTNLTAGLVLRYQPGWGILHGVGGEARVDCRLSAQGRAEDCRVLSEAPAGWGYGKAAQAVIERLQADAAAQPELVGQRFEQTLRWTSPGGIPAVLCEQYRNRGTAAAPPDVTAEQVASLVQACAEQDAARW